MRETRPAPCSTATVRWHGTARPRSNHSPTCPSPPHTRDVPYTNPFYVPAAEDGASCFLSAARETRSQPRRSSVSPFQPPAALSRCGSLPGRKSRRCHGMATRCLRRGEWAIGPPPPTHTHTYSSHPPPASAHEASAWSLPDVPYLRPKVRLDPPPPRVGVGGAAPCAAGSSRLVAPAGGWASQNCASLWLLPWRSRRFSLLASRFFSLLASSRFSLLASRFALLASRFSLLASRFSPLAQISPALADCSESAGPWVVLNLDLPAQIRATDALGQARGVTAPLRTG